ncbi:MAG: hypothetical protein U5N58_14810 [Actinomycetota bacterium]|nr:hypothetical protein [Actinomycetota bacterium]
MFEVSVPIITVLIGEGGSGGALALAIGNEVLMLENSTYSVISPEGCRGYSLEGCCRIQAGGTGLKNYCQGPIPAKGGGPDYT